MTQIVSTYYVNDDLYDVRYFTESKSSLNKATISWSYPSGLRPLPVGYVVRTLNSSYGTLTTSAYQAVTGTTQTSTQTIDLTYVSPLVKYVQITARYNASSTSAYDEVYTRTIYVYDVDSVGLLTFDSQVTLNSAKFTWNRPANCYRSEDLTYQYKLVAGGVIDVDWTDIGANTYYTVENLKYGTNYVYIRALFTDDSDFDGTSTYMTRITSALAAPVLSWTSRSTINSGVITWTRPTNAVTADALTYEYKIESPAGTIIDWTNISNVLTTTISDLIYDLNTVSIRAIFTADTDYNSLIDDIIVSETTLTKIPTPSLSLTENYELVEGVSGITSITLNWGTLSNIYNINGYHFIDSNYYWDVPTQVYITDATETDLASTVHEQFYTELTSAIGAHTYTVQAYFDDDTDFDSLVSTEEITTSITSTPAVDDLAWDLTTYPNKENYANWTLADDENYYLITMNPSYGSAALTFQTTGLEINVLDITGTPPNYIGASSEPWTELIYTTNIICRSYNVFYDRPSVESNNILYTIRKNGTPTNLAWDQPTSTLTWTGGTYNNLYTIYEVGTTTALGTSTTESFTYAFDASIHTLYVVGSTTSIISTVDYNIYENPTYLDSDHSEELPFGVLETPEIRRSGKDLNWNGITNPQKYTINYIVEDNTVVKGQDPATTFDMTGAIVGSHSFRIRATTTSGGLTFYSPYSNTKTYTVVKIATPIIAFNAGTCELYFATVSNTSTYKLYINGAITELSTNYTSGSPYVITNTAASIYSIYMQCVNDDTFLYNSSDASTTLTYSIYNLPKPTGTSYTGATAVLTWDAMANTDTYDIYLNDIFYINVATNSYTFSLVAGSYSTYVIGKHTDSVSNPNPLYYDSSATAALPFGVLEIPVITIDDNVLSWSTIDNAEYYEIYNYGTLLTTTEELSYTMTSLVPTSYSIYIWAKTDSDEMDDTSSISNTIGYIITKLNTPVIELNSSFVLSWGAISNTDYYQIYLNGEELATVSGSVSYNITAGLSTGVNIVTVKAFSDLYKYLDSETSNSIRYVKESPQQYLAKIDGTDYEVWLPFTFLTTVDETLDNATLILAPITRKTPFELDMDIQFYVFGEDLDTVLSPSPYDMIITNDEVEEVQVGTTSKWKHKITMIERTKLLQYDVLPDSSNTQPLDYIKSKAGDFVLYDIDGNSFFSEPIVFKPTFGNQILTHSYGLKGQALNGSLEESYTLGRSISLPVESASNYVFIERINRLFLSDITSEYLGNLTKKYYYRPYDATYTTYDYDKTSGEVLIGSSTDSSIVNWTPSATGFYDIILEVDIVDASNIPVPTIVGEYSTNSYPLELMKTSPDCYISQTIQYRVVWKNIEITATGAIVDSLATKLDVALEKVVNIIEPLEYRLGVQSKSKYSIDDAILRIAKDINLPESKFENGKTLYEVLKQYGRNFYGTPRLLANDTITFDIIKTNLSGNSVFEDGTSLMNVKTNAENHHTGFISNSSSILSDTTFEVFPSNDTWATPRSQSENDPFVTRDNMAIVLPRGINKLTKVKVRNFLTASPETEVDITAFINEQTIFESINSNIEGKGLSLYYKDTDNKIYGLGVIPEASELYATMGFAETDYVIEKILTYLGYTATNNINDFEYKVWYKSYVDARLYNEKSNISGIKKQSYKPFNQEDNTTSDINFGKSISTQLERLGNNDIQQTYRIYDYTKIPYVGQIKTFEDDRYYADQVAYVLQNGYIDVTVNYSKNINKINERNSIDSAYRPYSIIPSNYVTRDINANRYMYISQDAYELEDNYGNNWITGRFKYSLKGLTSGLADPCTIPDSLYVKTMNANHDQLEYLSYESTTLLDVYAQVPGIVLPLAYRNLKNNILLTAEFKTNYSAGISAGTLDDTSIPSISHTATLQYIQKDVRYVDNAGENSFMNFTICSPTESQITSDATIKIGRTLPAAKYITTTYMNSLDTILFDAEYKIDKDNRERLRFNYQLHFKTYDKDINIGIGLFKYLFLNPVLDNSTVVGRSSPIMALYVGDIKGKDDLTSCDIFECSEPTIAYDVAETTEGGLIRLTTQGLTGLTKEYDGVAYIWPDTKEVLFSFNDSITASTYTIPNFYFKFANRKIDYKTR